MGLLDRAAIYSERRNIREYSYKGMTAYEVGEFGEIVFPPSKFKKTGNEIYINEIPMGKFMNAIVTAVG